MGVESKGDGEAFILEMPGNGEMPDNKNDEPPGEIQFLGEVVRLDIELEKWQQQSK